MSKRKLFSVIAIACLATGIIMVLSMPLFVYHGVDGFIFSPGEPYTMLLTMREAEVGWASLVVVILDLIGILSSILLLTDVVESKSNLFSKIIIFAGVFSMLVIFAALFFAKQIVLPSGADQKRLFEEFEISVSLHLRLLGWIAVATHLAAVIFGDVAGKQLF